MILHHDACCVVLLQGRQEGCNSCAVGSITNLLVVLATCCTGKGNKNLQQLTAACKYNALTHTLLPTLPHFQAIRTRVITYPSHLSPEAKDFLQIALTRDPNRRATAKQLLQHPFIQAHCPRVSRASSIMADGVVTCDGVLPTAVSSTLSSSSYVPVSSSHVPASGGVQNSGGAALRTLSTLSSSCVQGYLPMLQAADHANPLRC